MPLPLMPPSPPPATPWLRSPPDLCGSTPPAEWWVDRDLAARLFALVEQHDLSSPEAERVLADLDRQCGHLVYAELIFLLTRLRFDPDEACRHWPGVLARREALSDGAGQPIDIRVALLSYFLDIDRQLARPKIVEMNWAEWTASSALLDEVTGLPNQRFFRAELEREVERSLREGTPLSLAVLDADGFKAINDTLGHEAGTATLKDLGAVLRGAARGGDLVVRYGGDEFVVLMAGTAKADAARLAEDLREAACRYRVGGCEDSVALAVTFSVGIATCPADAREATALFVAADRALYDAKRAGRDCVRLSGESSRSFARRRASWPARVTPAGMPAFDIETVEVGEGGFSFRSATHLPADLVLDAALVLPDGERWSTAGRVAWSRIGVSGGYEVAVRFVEHGTKARKRLSHWICAA